MILSGDTATKQNYSVIESGPEYQTISTKFFTKNIKRVEGYARKNKILIFSAFQGF